MLSIPVRFLLGYCAVFMLNAQPKLFPVDETQKDRGFASYVRQLKKAVTQRDAKSLRKLIDVNIAVQEMPELKGWAEFEKKWTPADPKSRVWSTLEDFLDLGFIQETPYTFLSPYVVWRFPNHLDPARHWVVAWGDEPLREEPNARSKEVRRIAFEIVKRVAESGPRSRIGESRWAEVETLDGSRGWMSLAALKPPTMPHAQFNFEKGRWLMVMLED
jgi:hypothetical protein